MGFTTDDRAQSGTARSAVVLVVTLVVATIVGAVLAPVAIDSIEGDDNATLEQDTGTTYEVNGALDSTVTETTDGSSATVELNDTRTSGTTSNTVTVGSTAAYDMQGGTVNVTVDSATGTGATVTYEHDRDYAMSGGASSLWGILGLVIVLGMFLLVLGKALDYT